MRNDSCTCVCSHATASINAQTKEATSHLAIPGPQIQLLMVLFLSRVTVMILFVSFFHFVGSQASAILRLTHFPLTSFVCYLELKLLLFLTLTLPLQPCLTNIGPISMHSAAIISISLQGSYLQFRKGKQICDFGPPPTVA